MTILESDVSINEGSDPAATPAPAMKPAPELPFAVRHPVLATTGNTIVTGLLGAVVLAGATAIITATNIGVRRLLKPVRPPVIHSAPDSVSAS